VAYLIAERDDVVRREVFVGPDSVRIIDHALPCHGSSMQVTWLLHPNALKTFTVDSGSVERIEAREGDVVGWFSPTYGLRLPSHAIRVCRRATNDRGCRLETIIRPSHAPEAITWVLYPFSRDMAMGGKRCLDAVVALGGLIVLSPVLLIVATCVLGSVGTPVLFAQLRPGLRGRPFRLYKFRTMAEEFALDGTPLPDAARLTRLGRLLRSTSLDELPELWNVLTGDMSLVGPRPLLMEYLPLYTPEQARRHEVRPGITGWAQVNGRNETSWEERFKLDVWYVDNHSLALDMRILFRTVHNVVGRKGISHAGEVTMPKFRGSERWPQVRDGYSESTVQVAAAAASCRWLTQCYPVSMIKTHTIWCSLTMANGTQLWTTGASLPIGNSSKLRRHRAASALQSLIRTRDIGSLSNAVKTES
jgi:lipopolysaccharide/colanic/teichoic acid biosynthesis glycosyltransferase